MIFNVSKKIINIIFFVLFLILGTILLARLKGHFVYDNKDLSVTITFAFTFAVIFLALVQLIVNLTVNEEIQVVETSIIEDDKNGNEKNKNEDQKVEERISVKSNLDTKEILNRIVPNKLPKIEEYGETLLINLSKEFDIVQGVLHSLNLSDNLYYAVSFYAYFADKKPDPFKVGETLPGQAARNKNFLLMENIPDNYIHVLSGLGKSNPRYLIFIPVVKEDYTIAVIELASFKKFSDEQIQIFKELGTKVSTTLNSYVKGTEKTKDGKEQNK